MYVYMYICKDNSNQSKRFYLYLTNCNHAIHCSKYIANHQ